MAQIGDQIKSELENFGLDTPEDEVMSKLTGLCSSLVIKPSDIADQWMAFSVNNCNLDLDLEGVTKFEKFKLTKTQRSPAIKKENRKSAVNVTTHIGDLFDDILGAYLPESSPVRTASSQKRPLESPRSFRVPKVSKTPTRASGHHISRMSRDLPSSLSPVNASPSQSYSQRKGAGDVVCTFNEGGVPPVTSWTGEGKVTVTQPDTALRKPYQYMFQKLSSKAGSLDEHVDDMGQILAEHHGVQFENSSIPCQTECKVVGRICCDSAGKMNASSVLLEGSLKTSHGKAVSVDLQLLERYALFPGQVVAMSGTNPTGRKFLATKLLDPVPLKTTKSDTVAGTLTIFGACGPYTSQDSLSYEPLYDLLRKVQEGMPDVLVLFGPFVDVKHPLIEKCDIGNMTLEDLFSSQIRHITQSLPDTTHLIIVPSHRDATCDCVYPQPPPEVPAAHNVTVCADPAVVEINGVTVALTSTDVLFHLSSEEISHPPGSDRLGRLAGHLLHQQNLYPLHPPAEEINIDYPHFLHHAYLDSKPDILLLPSDLRYFAKNVQGTVVVNPGKLAKGSGTYFRLQVQGKGDVTNSTFVNVVKI